MKIKTFCPGFLKRDQIRSFEEFTGSAKNNFTEFERNGAFDFNNTNDIFVYRITSFKSRYTGIVALHDYEDLDSLLGHELTLFTKETELLKVLSEIKTMIKPVLVAFNSNDKVDNIISDTIKNKPFKYIPGEDENEVHEFWKINNPSELISLFENDISIGFIADGHHRHTIHKFLYNNKEKYDFQFNGMMCYYLSFTQLEICSYNRGLIIEPSEKDSILEALIEYGTISELPAFQFPNVKHDIVIIFGKQSYNFKWHKEYTNFEDELVFDMDLFNECILANIFGIEDYRENNNIIYIEGSFTEKELFKKSKRDNMIIFLFNAVTADDIVKVSLQRKCLPPKSTWFLPRIKSGVVNCKI